MNKNTPLYLHYRNQLSQTHLFKGLSNDTLDKMLPSLRFETWRKNTQSIGQQLKDRFYVIIDDRIENIIINPSSGKSIALAILGKGDAFDIVTLLDHKEHEHSAVALDDVQLLSAPIDSVRQWLDEYRNFNHNFMPYLAQRMRIRESLISDLALYDTSTRLARLLLRYIDCNYDGSHHKHLQALKSEGIINTKHHQWTVDNLDALKEKAGKTLDKIS